MTDQHQIGRCMFFAYSAAGMHSSVADVAVAQPQIDIEIPGNNN